MKNACKYARKCKRSQTNNWLKMYHKNRMKSASKEKGKENIKTKLTQVTNPCEKKTKLI